MKVLPALVGFLGMAAIVAGVAGLAGMWAAFICGGVLAIVWSVLAAADRGGE